MHEKRTNTTGDENVESIKALLLEELSRQWNKNCDCDGFLLWTSEFELSPESGGLDVDALAKVLVKLVEADC